jgi:outer membrane protein OmpA-like peptidoglycan-associated protein
MKRLVLVAVLLAFGAACANKTPSPEVVRVKREYNDVLDDPRIDAKNSIQLLEASKEIQAAEAANRSKDFDVVTHNVYMAETRIRIARLNAETKLANQQAESEMKNVAMRARALEKELADLEARQTERGAVLALGGVHFDFNDTELKPDASRKLSRLAGFLIANPNRNVLVEGYGDIVGPDPANEQVSQARAEAVKRYLVANGIAPERITVVAYGGADPLESNKSDEGRGQNRRAQITILPPGVSAQTIVGPPSDIMPEVSAPQ